MTSCWTGKLLKNLLLSRRLLASDSDQYKKLKRNMSLDVLTGVLLMKDFVAVLSQRMIVDRHSYILVCRNQKCKGD